MQYQTVLVEIKDRIAKVILNRPDKKNAMNPQLVRDMAQVFEDLRYNDEAAVLVLTGAGDAFCAGMDLKEFFHDLKGKQPVEYDRIWRLLQECRGRTLRYFPKPTIAMVNGYCFGGAFTPLIACDFAIAAEDAVFGLSEINWGIFPGGLVSRVLVDAMCYRDAVYYIMTGDPFDGKKAAEMKLVNFAVPRAKLREETVKLAKKLMEKNPRALAAAKEVYKLCRTMDYAQAEDYMGAKGVALRATDPEKGRETGMKQFLDDKTYRPGLGPYQRKKA